jgi:polysaccharide biosynthesis transport protein
MTTLPQSSLRLPRASSAMQQFNIPGAMAPAAAHAAPAHQMTGADVWRVIRSNMWLILILLIASVIGGYLVNLYLLRYHPRYTAKGIVAISPPVQMDPLKTSDVNVDSRVLLMQQQATVLFLKDPTLYGAVLRNENSPIRDTAWFNQFHGNIDLAELELDDALIVIPSAEAPLLRVEMATRDPQDGKKIIEAVVDQLIANESAENSEYQQERNARLTAMRQRYEQRRTDLVDDMREKEVRLNISGLSGSGRLNVKETAQSELQGKKMEAELAYNLAQDNYQRLDQQISAGQDPPVVAEALNHDPDVQRYQQVVSNYDIDMLRINQRFGPENEQVTEMKAEQDVFSKKLEQAESNVRAQTRIEVLDEARREVESSKLSMDRVNQEIAGLENEIKDLNKDLSDYQADHDQLTTIETREKDIDEQLEQISQFINQKDQTNLEWKSRPDVSDIPTFPKLSITMTLSILVGLCLSLGIAFLRELMDTTVRSPRDITRVGQMTVLGMVPHEDDDPQSRGTRLPLVIFEAPHSVMAEQLRQVRTRLQHAASLDTTRTLLITSPSPDDGKSTIAANLASGLALNGRRILLVDANFRRPAVHKMFNLPNDVGFSDVLNKVEMFETAVRETQVPNLYVLPSGLKPTNATELLESQLLTDFIERALEEFDHVIFDSGPLLFVSETVALAPRVDGVVTVVRARANTRGLLQRLRDSLRQIKAEHLGVVLNAVRSQGGGYYRSNIRTYYDYQNGHAA